MGKTQTIADRVDPARAEALMVMLGGAGRFASGEALPPLSHLLYFWDVAPPEALAEDGHEKLGGMIPDMGLPRRMWGGGRMTFHAPFRAGIAAERTSRLVGAARKEGRSGKLAVVTVRHDIRQGGKPVLTEDQDIVYRDAPQPGDTPAPEVADPGDEALPLTVPRTMLFRYSALTMNAHRIHYDDGHAAEMGYGGLVVHGPLLATLLAMCLADRLGALAAFSFRATAPLVMDETAELRRSKGRAWIAGADGRLCMMAEGRSS